MRGSARYIVILLAVLALWNTIIIKPLRIFAVFLHELGHAIMALIFGYGILDFAVNINESGHTVVSSKSWFASFMIANAGYMGTLLLGLLILFLKKTKVKRFILGTTAIIFLAITIRFSFFSFAMIYSVLFAIAVVIIYMIRKDNVEDWIIDIVGISSIAYAIYDTFVDVILLQLNLHFQLLRGWGGTQPMTDAARLAGLTGIPAMVWGLIWFSISVFAMYTVLFRKKSAGYKKSRY